MFRYFDVLDYAIIVAFLIIAFLGIQYLLKKHRKRNEKEPKVPKIVLILSGAGVTVIAVVLIIYIQNNIDTTSLEILKPVASITSEPITLFSIALLIIGISLIIYALLRKKEMNLITDSDHGSEIDRIEPNND